MLLHLEVGMLLLLIHLEACMLLLLLPLEFIMLLYISGAWHVIAVGNWLVYIVTSGIWYA